MPSFLKLKKRADFVRLTKSGVSLPTSSIVIQAAKRIDNTDSFSRIGFTTTKKLGKAVVRNRCRRRLRAVAAKFFQKLALPNTDYVLIARYNTAEVDFKTLCGDFSYGLKKINQKLTPDSIKDEKC